MTNTTAVAAIITSKLNDPEFVKAGHGKHDACSHPASKSARAKCRAARRLAFAGTVSDERTLTIMYAPKSATTHYIASTDDAVTAPVMACNGKPLKSVEFDEKPLDYVATCRNCAKLDATTTASY